MKFISAFRSAKLALAILTALTGWCGAGETAMADFFDIAGTSPAEVAATIPERGYIESMEVLLGGFVGLPMSDAHRNEFMAGLRGELETDPAQKPLTRLCLVNLLEEDGAFADALAVERAMPRAGGPAGSAREVALLWKAGKREEAANLADGMKISGSAPDPWLSLVRIDMTRHRPDEAMRLLDFLEKRPNFPGRLRYELAIQHLEIARRAGKTADLLAGTSPPVVRAVWHWALDHKQESLDAALAAGPEPAVSDIEMLVLAIGPNSPAGAYAKAALAKANITREDRRDLLAVFTNRSERLTAWLDMPAGHDETVDLVSSLPRPDELEKIPDAKRRLMEIVQRYPEDGNLNLLAASPTLSSPEEAKPFLLAAARAVRETPAAVGSDPAMKAFEILVKTSDPAELDRVLRESPAFATLSPEAQLRYLMAAELDTEVVKTMARCHFDQPAAGNAGQDLLAYFNHRAGRQQIPADVIATLLDRLPELALGSEVEPLHSYVLQRIPGSLIFLSGQATSEAALADAVSRLVTAASERNPAMRETVIRLLPASVRSLTGLEIPPPEKPVSPPFSRPTTIIFQTLSVFSPPDITSILWRGFSPALRVTGAPPRLFQISRGREVAFLFALSQYAQNFAGAADGMKFDPAIAAKLRTLLAGDPSRTFLYDLLVATGAIRCPDPEVKTFAEGRIADFNQPLPVDPAAGIFLFLQKLDKGETPDQAAANLAGYERYLLPVRHQIADRSSMFLRIKPPEMDVLRERFGLPKIPIPPPAEKTKPQPLDDYNRLQFFSEAEKLDSPEAVTLAREVLFKFIESKDFNPSPTQNIAIDALVATGNFPAFLTDLKSRMEAGGKSELEIQRALYRVHLYRIVHSKGETFPFAKRILELDPTDATVAVDVLAAATVENDRPLALKAMKALCSKSPFALARAIGAAARTDRGSPSISSPLSLFKGPEAHALAALMLDLPFKRDSPNFVQADSGVSYLLPLYLHFAQNNIDDLRPILRWAGAISPANAWELIKIAESLVRQEKVEDAVNLLAEAYFAPPVLVAVTDLRFPLKPLPAKWDPNSLTVGELHRLHLLKPLAEAAARYPTTPGTAKIRVMIALAADPTTEAWDRIVTPFLAASPVGNRPELATQFGELIPSNMPEATALNRRLALEKQAADTAPPTLYTVSSKMRLAAESGEAGSIASDWATLRGLPAPQEPYRQALALATVSWPMAKFAADPEWREFTQEARNTGDFTKYWLQQFPGKLATDPIVPQRLQDLAAIVLPNLKPEVQNSSQILALFRLIATSESPDVGLLQKFRPWIESVADRPDSPQAAASVQFLDLLTGDPSAVSPQVDAIFTSASWQVSWSLAGSRGARIGYPFARKFPFLDGRFDLEILAGSHSDRLDVVQKIPAAASTGRVDVKLPPGSRFLSLLARKRDGGIVRWADPQEIGEPAASAAIALPETLERLPASGPFFLEDAFRVKVTPDTTLELAQLPWAVGAPMPQVSGWMQGGHPTQIELSFRDADGVEIASRPLQFRPADLDGMPSWERFSTPTDLTPHPETETIALVVKTTRYDSAGQFLLSGVRQTTTAPTADLPPGLTLLGRVPGMSGVLVMDRKASRFATASIRGIGVFDLASGKFSGWISIGDPADRQQVGWLALAGDRVVFATESGVAHVLSLGDRKVRKIGNISNFGSEGKSSDTVALSADGNFLAWSGGMAGLHIVKIGDAGEPAERLLETGQIHSLKFDGESKTLIARSGHNLITLPLADWKNAGPTITVAPLRGPEERYDPYFRIGGPPVADARYGIGISTGDNRTLAQVAVTHRMVTLPQGLLALDHDGVPYFIDSYGQVLRIDSEKLRGYDPQPTR